MKENNAGAACRQPHAPINRENSPQIRGLWIKKEIRRGRACPAQEEIRVCPAQIAIRRGRACPAQKEIMPCPNSDS